MIAALGTVTADEGLGDFCDGLDRFLAKKVDAHAIDASHSLPPGLLSQLAELGVFGVSIPEAWGGSGLGLAGAAAVVETIARHDRSVATTVGLHLGLGTRGIVAYGTDVQRARWLPELAAGTRLGAFATTEPSAGSDLSRLATRARLDPATDRLRVDGQKAFVTNGGLAQTFTVAAATEGLGGAASGQNLLILDRADGIVVGAEEKKLGLRGSSTTPIYFDGLDIPMDRILGPPGAGHHIIGAVLAFGRTAMAAGCNGTAAAAIKLATAHVVGRRQFGKSLSDQPVVRLQLVDMAAGLFAMQAIVHATCQAEDDGDLLERLSVVAKVYCSDTDWQICDMALQLQGGSGFLEESGAPLLLRDARITRIFEGANDVLLSRLGALELTRPADPADDIVSIHPICELVRETREGGLKYFGLKLLRDPVRLHQLGRLAMLRDVAVAVVTHTGPSPDAETVALCKHALLRLTQAAESAAIAPPDYSDLNAIAESIFKAVNL